VADAVAEAVPAAGTVFVGIQDIDRTFTRYGEGRLAVIDPVTDEVVGSIPLGGKNPGALEVLVDAEGRSKIYVALSGIYPGLVERELSGGVFVVDVTNRAVERVALDDDDAGVVFDSRARTLAIVAPVRPYSARLARAHAAFLRRARRDARKKTTQTERLRGKKKEGADRDGDSRASSDSEWVETDGEAQQGSADEGEAQQEEADEARGLAEDMGMMGLAATPNTRARRARVA